MINSISIIYPIYNEEKRIKNIFNDINNFNKKSSKILKEYIFVNDGSNDNSLNIIKKKIDKFFSRKNYKIVSYKQNKGKGFALKKGVQKAKYSWILTADADCSVSNMQLIEWMKKKKISNNSFIFFGSRNLKNSDVKKKTSRKLFGIIFQFFVKLFFNINLKDTQCGFKLYKSNIAKKIFKKIFTKGYMHDIEICIIAKKLNFNIVELPLKWVHKDGSKISFFGDIFKILYALIKISRHKYDY